MPESTPCGVADTTRQEHGHLILLPQCAQIVHHWSPKMPVSKLHFAECDSWLKGVTKDDLCKGPSAYKMFYVRSLGKIDSPMLCLG